MTIFFANVLEIFATKLRRIFNCSRSLSTDSTPVKLLEHGHPGPVGCSREPGLFWAYGPQSSSRPPDEIDGDWPREMALACIGTLGAWSPLILSLMGVL